MKIKVHDRVRDGEGYTGIVVKVEDRHNIYVEYDGGGQGIYCLVKKCEGYDPLTKESSA